MIHLSDTPEKPVPPSADEIAAGDFIVPRIAAKRMGIHPSAVYKLMDRGELVYARPCGRTRRVSLVFLDYYLRTKLVVR